MSKKLTYEVVYDRIREKIKEGIWKPGDQIPTVEQLCEEFSVGISSVREASRILGKQKILSIEQGRGTFVTSGFEAAPSDRFDFLEKANLVQLTEARLVVEPELAALAAEKATKKEVTAILQSAQEMERRLKENEDFFDVDLDFHYQIAKASKNEILFQMIDVISDLLADSRRKSMKFEEINVKAAHYHILIAKAIDDRNPTQARILMKAHLDDLLHELNKTKKGK